MNIANKSEREQKIDTSISVFVSEVFVAVAFDVFDGYRRLWRAIITRDVSSGSTNHALVWMKKTAH